MKAVIETYVVAGTTIYTDCWKAYAPACVALGHPHRTINHSQNFVDPEDNTIHTQGIESMWG